MSPERPPPGALNPLLARGTSDHDGASLLSQQHQCSIVAVRPGVVLAIVVFVVFVVLRLFRRSS